MKLHKKPFDLIKDYSKTIELRLFDEKRQKIKIGDQIEFSLIDTPKEKIKVGVIDLMKFKSFKEMFTAIDYTKTGNTSKNDWKKMRAYYSEKEEREFGVLGISIKLLR